MARHLRKDDGSGQFNGSRPLEGLRNAVRVTATCGFVVFALGSFALRPAQEVTGPSSASAAQAAAPECAPGTGPGTASACDPPAQPLGEAYPVEQAPSDPRADVLGAAVPKGRAPVRAHRRADGRTEYRCRAPRSWSPWDLSRTDRDLGVRELGVRCQRDHDAASLREAGARRVHEVPAKQRRG